MNSTVGPKIYRYARFAKFGGPMSSAMAPPKKGQTQLRTTFSAIQTHLVIFNYLVMSFLSNLQLILNLTLKSQNSSNFLLF